MFMNYAGPVVPAISNLLLELGPPIETLNVALQVAAVSPIELLKLTESSVELTKEKVVPPMFTPTLHLPPLFAAPVLVSVFSEAFCCKFARVIVIPWSTANASSSIDAVAG